MYSVATGGILSKKTVKSSKKHKSKKVIAKKAQKPLKGKSSVKLRHAPKAVKKSVRTAKIKEKKLTKKEIRKREEELRIAREIAEREAFFTKNLEKINGMLTSAFTRQSLVNLAGENSLAIIRNFDKNVSDDDISKKLKLKISDVRATLNKLHGAGLVTYLRDKNSETGWYSYTWMASADKIEKWIAERLEERRLNATSGGEEHYFCSACGVNSIHNFESAYSSFFKCNLCSKDLEFLDDVKREELVFGRKK
jgi:transcription factor E